MEISIFIIYKIIELIKKPAANKVHIAGRGSVVCQLRILVSQFRVLWTGTRSEIRPDNMYQPINEVVGVVNSTYFYSKTNIHHSLNDNSESQKYYPFYCHGGA